MTLSWAWSIIIAVNWLWWPIWRLGSGSTSAQIMDWWLTAPSHYLNPNVGLSSITHPSEGNSTLSPGPQPSITEICLKFTYLEFHLNLQGRNELTDQAVKWPVKWEALPLMSVKEGQIIPMLKWMNPYHKHFVDERKPVFFDRTSDISCMGHPKAEVDGNEIILGNSGSTDRNTIESNWLVTELPTGRINRRRILHVDLTGIVDQVLERFVLNWQ